MLSQAKNFQLISRHKSLDLSTPKIMGILNITPDSFSDGGRYTNLDDALRQVEYMIEQGVHIVDIGGESTRPNALPVSSDVEIARVLPVVMAIRQRFGDELWLSLDTSNPSLMQAGIEAGADMINDVRALTRKGAAAVAASLNVPVVLMHHRGEPDEMNRLASYHDVLNEVIAELGNHVNAAIQAGVSRDNIIIDVGMGFAKNFAEHRILTKNLDKVIGHFGLPMLFGVSRKRFLGEILQNGQKAWHNHEPSKRDTLGAAMSLLAVQAGASIVRVHDVVKTAQVLSLWQQIYGDE